MNARALSLSGLAVLLLCHGCAARRIPGTELEDSPDTRAILQVMEQYRSAMESRDANALVQLVSESFKDDGGTGTPEDDLDYATLRRSLPERLQKIDDVRLEISVRRVNVEKDTASVIYYYNARFRLPRLTDKTMSEGDLKQMWFKRVGSQWKILSGI